MTTIAVSRTIRLNIPRLFRPGEGMTYCQVKKPENSQWCRHVCDRHNGFIFWPSLEVEEKLK